MVAPAIILRLLVRPIGRLAVTMLAVGVLATGVEAQGPWVQWNRNMTPPAGTPAVGRDANGRPFHVCRVTVGDGVFPGKRLRDGTCSAIVGERVIEADSYQLLRSAPGRWMSPRFASTAPFVAGSADGQPLVLCRVAFADGVHPGTVVEGSCQFAYSDSRMEGEEFEILAGPPGGSVAAAPVAAAPAARTPARPEVAGGVTWSPWNATLGPPHPMSTPIAGRDSMGQQMLYACRATVGSVVVSGFRAADGHCHVAWGDRAHRFNAYHLLTAARGSWQQVVAGPPLRNTLMAGRGPTGQPLALCRAPVRNGAYPGFVWDNACHFVRSGREVSSRQFSVLVVAN